MPTRRPLSQFVEYLSEVFRSFGVVEARPMFGGHGIYYQGLIFGLVIGETLYLKSDTESAPRFQAAGSKPFQYLKRGQMTQTSYYTMPAEAFDDPDIAKEWATAALEASLRAKYRKQNRSKRKGQVGAA